MAIETTIPATALGLVFVLGLRHGLDPDHIAVVDNLTFRAAEDRPALAPWVGTLFALGHSISVGIVAIMVSLFAGFFQVPAWISGSVDWLVIGLLLLVGILNLRALLRTEPYRPIGWRQGLVPRALRETTHPAGIIAIGMIFGLVFDTVTQAAAWGAAASASGGLWGTLTVVGVFAAGMMISDTADSQIVARLLRSNADPARVRYYRRSVGWIIVALSFGMAIYMLLGMAGILIELPDFWFTTLGVAMALSVILILGLMRNKTPNHS